MMKIAICTPHYGDVTPEYAFSLSNMILRAARTQLMFNDVPTVPDMKIFMRSSSVLPQLRNRLVKDASDWGANYLLWIDADQSFPDWSLLGLLSLNLPIVGVNYPRRGYPTWPTALSLDGKHVWTTEALAKAGHVQQVHSLGLGLCLMDMHVLDAVRRQTGADGAAKALFAMEMIGDGTEIIGEDTYFFRRIRDAGIAVHLDHALSWEIGHVCHKVLTNTDAAEQKEMFDSGEPISSLVR